MLVEGLEVDGIGTTPIVSEVLGKLNGRGNSSKDDLIAVFLDSGLLHSSIW